MAFARTCAVLLGLALSALPSYGFAAEPAFVVAEFQGMKPVGIREQVVALMEAEGFRVVKSDEAPAVNPAASTSRFAALAEEGGYRGFVMAYTSMNKGGWSTSFTVRSGDTGDVVGKRTITAAWYPGLQKAIDKHFIPRLGPTLKRAQAPEGAAAEPAPVAKEERPPPPAAPVSAPAAPEEPAEPPKDAEPDFEFAEDTTAEADLSDAPSAPPKRASGDLLTAVEVGAGPSFVQRAWAVNDLMSEEPYGRLAPTHDVPLFGARIDAVFYPVAYLAKTGAARHFGVDATASQSFVGGTRVGSATEPRQTQFLQWAADLRGRIPLGNVEVGIFGGLGRQALTIDGDKIAAPQPDTKYRFYQAGADLRWPLSKKLHLDALAAYRYLTAFGEAAEQLQNPRWFPDTTGQGVQGRLGVAYTLHPHVRLRLGGHFANYGLAFNPDFAAIERAYDQGAFVPPLAGGATDRYWGVDFSVVLVALR